MKDYLKKSEPTRDQYPWLNLKTKHAELMPKLKKEIMVYQERKELPPMYGQNAMDVDQISFIVPFGGTYTGGM